MDLKLQDIKEQLSEEIISRCSGCDRSLLAITMGVFRCFPGSESAVTYRALLHETHQISALELQHILEEWISSGRAIAVQSLVLQVDPSCPVLVTQVNDAECLMINTPPLITTKSATGSNTVVESDSNSNPIAVIVGGASGATLGVVLLVGVVVIVVIVTIVKHKQAMANLKHEAR